MGVYVRERYYQGSMPGKILAILIALVDWIIPTVSRKLLFTSERVYPITVAQWILMQDLESIQVPDDFLDVLVECAAYHDEESISWGLGFPWMSKNGLYGSDVPFITHTPYAMEALLHLNKLDGPVGRKAIGLFDKTLPFLESLKKMYESKDMLAVSYAPVIEPRIVINANAYAALSYALHFKRQQELGNDEVAGKAKMRAVSIVRWILNEQNEDGSWDYYADDEPGNFIDCFHSCFVLKNLRKAGQLIIEIEDLSAVAIQSGIQFLQSSFFQAEKGLVKRFTKRDIKDPFVWDLYDQAEYLGLLIDQGDLKKAGDFSQTVNKNFRRGDVYFNKIDIFGRLWGKNYLRWGVMPFLYQENRLKLSLEKAVGI